jgi:phenylacetic acid degradation operon negative regulatory protein
VGGRPDNLPPAASTAEDWAVADAQVQWWTATPDDSPDVERLFGVSEWGSRALVLCAELARVVPALEAEGAAPDDEALAAAFVAGAAALAHVRADPLLPGVLLPAGWPGDELRDRYRSYQVAFSGAVARWFRTP